MSKHDHSFLEGTPVITISDVERYPHFTIPRGVRGIIEDIGGSFFIFVPDEQKWRDEIRSSGEDWKGVFYDSIYMKTDWRLELEKVEGQV